MASIIDLAISYHRENGRAQSRRERNYARHAKRNHAIEICKKLKWHWKANDNTIYIEELDETFTHSQTDELIRRLSSLEPFYL